MRRILIVGAGRSSSALVRYLLEKSGEEQLRVIIADINTENAARLVDGHPNGEVIELDIFDLDSRKKAVAESDIVISMLPARFHLEVARDCIEFGKNLVTASYISKELKELDPQVRNKGLIFMNEVGLDPGIDHMSAMQVIDRIKGSGARMLLFESFTGGYDQYSGAISSVSLFYDELPCQRCYPIGGRSFSCDRSLSFPCFSDDAGQRNPGNPAEGTG